MFYFKESKLALETKYEVSIFEQNKSQLQNLQKFKISTPNNLSRLNFKGIGTPYLVQNLKYDFLTIIFREQDGTEFQKAGKKLTSADILNVINKYNTQYTQINLVIDHDFVLEENVDLRTLNKQFFEIQINFNNRYFYKTILRHGGFKRQFVRNGKSDVKFIVPNGTRILNNNGGVQIEYY